MLRTVRHIAVSGFLMASLLQAGSIGIQTMSEYVHADGTLAAVLDPSSPTFFSTLDSNNLGTFGWWFTNNTGATLSNVALFGFLDADLDSSINTFFNEYGVFVGLSLPPGAPGGSIVASSWQIDEPGFVFGTIINDLIAGQLRNQNFVPSTAPDDVSTALGFLVGNLAPGQTATVTMRISTTNIGGLQQVDPDSLSNFYLNGYGEVSPLGSSGNDAPEPCTLLLIGFGFCCLRLCRAGVRRAESLQQVKD